MSKCTRFEKVARRKLSRRNPHLLRLWTLQPVDVWRQLEARGHLFVDPAFHKEEEFSICYKWMRKQLARRIPGYQGHFPWWAFTKKYDMRCCYGAYPNNEAVCLELQVEPTKVLLSDYLTWHFVIGQNFLFINEDEERETEEIGGYAVWNQPKEWRRRTIQSWERIFDMEILQSGGLWSTSLLQACFERLDLQDVVAVTELRERN